MARQMGAMTGRSAGGRAPLGTVLKGKMTMKPKTTPRLSIKLLAALFLLLAGARLPTAAQQPPPFGAVSIKPFRVGWKVRPGPLLIDPAGIHAGGITLARLIAVAYGIQDSQLLGGEAWTRRLYWAFAATTSAPAPENQVRLMLREALAERFGLTVKLDVSTVPAWALVVAPGGLRIPKLAPGKRPSFPRPTRPGECAHAGQSTFAGLANELNDPRPQLGKIAVDQTGLTGKYNITLYSPCDARRGPDGRMRYYEPSNLAYYRPALHQQLGIDLKPTLVRHTTVTLLSAHLPTAN